MNNFKMKILTHLFLVLLLLFTFSAAAGCTLIPPKTTSVNQLEVYFMDVGQADCEIVRCENANMIIDAGSNATASALVTTIKQMGINKFDVAVGTHPHEDHIGGLDAVINNFHIDNLYMPDVAAYTKTYTDVQSAIQSHNLKITSPMPGTTFNVGNAKCTVLAPDSQTYTELNDYSIVIRLDYGSTSFLFTGDAQTTSEKEMLAADYNLDSNVLKVGHHGSESSTSPQFLNAVSPQYAVIEVGAENDYGHPHQVTLDKLSAANVTVYRTDLNGTIEFKSDGSKLTVTTTK